MIFNVPLEKDSVFAQNLFSIISENVSDLVMEHDKLPNQILFTGPLGKEVLNFIQAKEWNFKGFSLESADGVHSALIFKYSSVLTQTEDRGGVIFDGGSLHNKQINGIPGPETTQKILSAYSSPGFIIERTVRPEKRITLVRS
jgi:hypothetical protein